MYPNLFAKLPTLTIASEENSVLAADAKDAHYEGGDGGGDRQRAQRASMQGALSYVFGVTAGNDVRERDWQKSDLQWFRAKASNASAPSGR